MSAEVVNAYTSAYWRTVDPFPKNPLGFYGDPVGVAVATKKQTQKKKRFCHKTKSQP